LNLTTQLAKLERLVVIKRMAFFAKKIKIRSSVLNEFTLIHSITLNDFLFFLVLFDRKN